MTPPAGFHDDPALGPPDLARSPQIHLTEWRAWRSADGAASLVGACFETRVDAWAPEADELALGKLRDTVSGTAVRAAGDGALAHVATKREDGTELVLASPPAGGGARGGAPRLDARAAQGFFDDARGPVLTSCFALCADRAAPSRCASSVADARFPSGHAEAPPPGLALGALLALVHHPTETAWGLVALAALGAAVALRTRKRPRSRRRAAR